MGEHEAAAFEAQTLIAVEPSAKGEAHARSGVELNAVAAQQNLGSRLPDGAGRIDGIQHLRIEADVGVCRRHDRRRTLRVSYEQQEVVRLSPKSIGSATVHHR